MHAIGGSPLAEALGLSMEKDTGDYRLPSMTLPREARILALGGLLSAGVALLHVAIIFLGAPAYRYFGAGERMAVRAEHGDSRPAVITAGLSVMFAVWSAYAFSGASVLRPLPFLRAGLIAIGAVYTMRGLVLIPQIVLTLGGSETVPLRHLAFSAASLFIGVAYLAGTRMARPKPD